jgi:Carboxypeptidase regulatory-like domain
MRKSKLKLMRVGIVLLAGLLGALQPAWGQEVTANIVGRITDPSGAPIKGAAVVATDVDRGTVWNAETNGAGEYNLLRLPIGTYTVKVTAPGFQSVSRAPFTLVLNQTAGIDVQMKVGSASETVEVSGAAPILQTQTVDVSTLIDANTNVSLPLASRNYLQLSLLAPGVTNVDPDGMRTPYNMLSSGRPYINGNREQANEYLIDGILNSEDKNNETGYTPSVDAIQEFNLITQNASAEFGNYQGGVVSVSTKSGTNKFHGGVYEFFRNDALNANKASAGWTRGVDNGVLGFDSQGVQEKPELRYNQFGATFGGPIIKDKLFFFADYQGQRLINAGPTPAQVLTSSARGGDFGQLCTDFGGTFNNAGLCTGATPPPSQSAQLFYPSGPNAGQPIPFNNLANAAAPFNTPSPVATALFGLTKNYPLPAVDTLAANNLFYKSGNSLNNNQGDLKIDYVLSNRDHLFGRWSQMDLNEPTSTGCVFCNSGAVEGSDQPVRNFVVNWTHSFRSDLLNEARFGFNAVRFDQRYTPTSSLGNISDKLGIAGGNLQAPGLVEIDITGSNGGAAALGLRNLIQVFHTTQGQLEDNLIYTRGRHQIKTGFQFVRERQDYIYQGNNGALGFLTVSALTGSSLADFWLGYVSTGGGLSLRDTGGVVSRPAQLRGNIFGAYVQDDWRVTPTLTMNLGLRFEDHTPLYEASKRAVNFGLTTGTIYTATGVDGTTKFGNQALYNNYLGIGDWLPRIGLAWTPTALGGKTVIRAGFGISEFMEGGGSNEELTLNLPFGILQQSGLGTLSQGFGATLPNPCPTINQSCYAGNRIRVYDQNFKPAMIDQWNLTIQHQLTNSLTLQVGYVGQRGAHLLNFEDIAQRMGLNAQGKIAQPGEPIVSQVAGPFLGGGSVPCAQTPGAKCGTPGSLYAADQAAVSASGAFVCCGALAGTNMSNSDQKYNALQAVLQKRMTNGLQAQIAYTFSKCMSNSPGYFGTGWGSTNATSSGGQPGWENIYNPRREWGPCYYDQTHILTSYVTYQLPLGRGKQFGHDMNPALNAVLGNWEIGGILTVHSGNALTLNEFGGWGIGGDTSHTGGIEPFTLSGRPNCSGPIKNVNRTVLASGNTPGYIQWFDTSNISDPANNTFGTCGVGNARGPRYANVDLSLHKGFLFTETTKLEFRFEALNAFNHPVWTFSGGPAGGSFDQGSSQLGRITGSQGARQLQLALKFYF